MTKNEVTIEDYTVAKLAGTLRKLNPDVLPEWAAPYPNNVRGVIFPASHIAAFESLMRFETFEEFAARPAQKVGE